jgi:hypothetical protein
MTRVQTMRVLDPHHHNGDRFWDGDQTLWEFDAVDGHDSATLLACVPRGDAFVPEVDVRRALEERPLSEWCVVARRSTPQHRPQIALALE